VSRQRFVVLAIPTLLYVSSCFAVPSISWAAPSSETASSVPALTKALTDSNERVRFRAAIALGKLGQNAPVALPGLIEVFQYYKNQKDGKAFLDSAIQALGDLTPQIEKQASQYSLSELDQLIPNLETVLAIADLNDEFKLNLNEKRVRQTLDILKQVRQQRYTAQVEALRKTKLPPVLEDPNALRKAFEVRYLPAGSMRPTLQITDRLLIDKTSSTGLKRGDIVFFSPTDILEKQNFHFPFIKRIIGLPGETIEVKQRRIYVNNQPLQESYIADPPQYQWGPDKIPADSYFVLGDVRNNSYDSHYWGFVPRSKIIGKAIAILYPFDRQRALDPLTPLSPDAQAVTAVFSSVLQTFSEEFTKQNPNVPLSDLNSTQDSSSKQAAAKALIGTMNRYQQAYFAETKQFRSVPQQVGYSYRFSIVEIDSKFIVQNLALATQDGVKSYIGIVKVNQTASGETTTSIICESEKLTREAPPKAPFTTGKLQSKAPFIIEKLQCPDGYQKILNSAK
jgi:signal peptidase I